MSHAGPPAPGADTWLVELHGRAWPISYLHTRGCGETLLYLHGLGGTSQDFQGAWNVTEWARHTLLAPDAPGCGRTRGHRTGDRIGIDDIVRCAETLVSRLGLNDLTVIGHSMGGVAGLLFTLRNPGLVRRFVSVEGNLGPEDCSLYSRPCVESHVPGGEEAFLNEVEVQLRESGSAGFERAARVLRQNVQTAAYVDYCHSIVAYSDRWPLLDDFVALECPHLYVYGSENRHLPHIPHLIGRGVPVAEVPDSNHFPFWSNPEAYYAALTDFIGDG